MKDETKVTRAWPIPKFHFRVDIREIGTISCVEISGQYIEYDEMKNSVSDFSGSKYDEITLKRAFTEDGTTVKGWIDQTNTNVIQRKSVTLTLIDESGFPVMCWQMVNALPKNYTGEEFDAGKNCVSMESFTLSHEGITRASGQFEHEKKNAATPLHKLSAPCRKDESTRTIHKDALQPENIVIHNAGLCLLAPWFPRLFKMLELMTHNGTDLKDAESRIRAIFILQRLVTNEDRCYNETELAFNRILTNCPFYVPLPRHQQLAENEMKIAESLLIGVKSNWNKLRGTSIRGFQQSFIERAGSLEEQNDKWMLSVELKAYDLLLDSLPWSYRMIRFPWMKKPIYVDWRNS